MKRILFLLFSLIAITSQAQVSLGGYIQPLNNSSYPVQIDSLGKGGYMVARDTTARNDIPCLRRKYGMAVYSQAQQKLYILKDSNCVNTWVEFSGSAYINTTQINDTSYYISRSDGTKDTFLFTGGGSGGGGGAVGNLQQVTDSGNTTTNAINIYSDLYNGVGSFNKLHLVEKNTDFYDSSYIDFNTPDYSSSDPLLTNIKIKQENASVDMGISAYNSSFINYDPYMNIKNSINTFSVNPRGFSILTSNKVFQINDDYFYFIKQSPNTQFYLKPLYSDSTRFHTLYTSKFDTTQVVDTIATLRDVRAGGGSGVTSVGSGYGIANSPTTITSTGSVIVDTSISGLSGKYLRLSDTTSLSNRINLKLNSSDSSRWVSSITRTPGKDSIIFFKNGDRFAIKDSVGTNPAPVGYYGAFQDTTTQTAASINTAYAVKLNTTDLTNGVSVVNDGSGNPTKIRLANTGIYNIQFSLQLEKTGGSGNMTADIWLRKNSVDIPSTTGKIVLTGSANASPVIAAWNYVLDLAAGDSIQLMWAVSNTNVAIVAASATSPHPSIPSVILTVTQQSGIMAGTGITAINSLTGAAQTMVVDSSNSTFKITSTGTSHTFTIPNASTSGVTRGLISNTQYTTFNSKLSASDTVSLSNRINLKLNSSDSGIYQTKYRSDTSRTNIYSGINGKLDKSMASYTFMANNTTATANATAQTFKDSGLKVYNGSITFTPVSPSGTTNNTYRWSQIGKLVTVRINLLYSVASGATLTQLVASLPSDCPAPEIPTGFSGASTTICPAFGYLFTSSTSSPTTLAATIGFLRSNSANNGYEIVLIRAAGSVAAAYITLTYFAQ